MTSKKISRMRAQYRKWEEVLDEFTHEKRRRMMPGSSIRYLLSVPAWDG